MLAYAENAVDTGGTLTVGLQCRTTTRQGFAPFMQRAVES
jgi:hypothetical protein